MPTANPKQGDRSLGPHFTREGLAHWPQTAIDMWNPVSSSLQSWSSQYGTTLTAVGLEWSSFLTRRLQQDIELPWRLASSRTPEEFWKHCSGFWLTMAHDYQRELDALARLGAACMQQSSDRADSSAAPNGGESDARSAGNAKGARH